MRLRRAKAKKAELGLSLVLAGAMAVTVLAQPPRSAAATPATQAASDGYDDGGSWLRSPWDQQARQDVCTLGQYLHLAGPKGQAAAQALMTGSADDRQAALSNYYGSNGPLYDAVHADNDDINDWQLAHQGGGLTTAQQLTGLPAPGNESYIDPAVGLPGWTQVPDYSATTNGFLQRSRDPQSLLQDLVTKADPDALSKAAAIVQSSTDSFMPWFGDKIGQPDAADEYTNASDIAGFLTAGGFPQASPAVGTTEFRTDVENLKTRWSGCNYFNPFDAHKVLTAEVTAAHDEWQAELDGQKTQRDDIATASIAAQNDLRAAAEAMDQAMAQAWMGQRLLELQHYEADYAKPNDPFTKDYYDAIPLTNQRLADVKTAIQQQLAIANAAAADAKAQADKVTADQAAAGAIAKATGTPYGRGLAYAQQSAQVTKASAAAAQSAALAASTALATASASAADAKALWANAATQSQALAAQFAKAAAAEAADQAHKAAAAAADKAASAAAEANNAHTARTAAEQAQADATAQAATAKTKRAAAETALSKASAAQAEAQKQRDQANTAAGQALTQQTAAATAHKNATDDLAAASAKAATAGAAEQTASQARQSAGVAAAAKQAADAKSQAAAATAAAAVGTSAAADAQKAADQAASAVTQAATTASAAADAAGKANTAAVAARSAATVSSSQAVKAQADAASADAASAQSASASWTAHAAAADAIAAAGAAAKDATAAQAAADDAAVAAKKAQGAADTARTNADAAVAGSAKTAGEAYAAAQSALVARDTAAAIKPAADEALVYGAPYQSSDAAAGLAVLTAQDAKTFGQQQDAAAQAAAAQAAQAAAAAKKAADQATGDAKDAATSAAQAAADTVAAQKSAAAARASAAAAATDDAAASAADTAAAAQAAQALTDAQGADTAAGSAVGIANTARQNAADAEKDAATAHANAVSAAADAKAVQQAAADASAAAGTAATSAANAGADAQKALDAAAAAQAQAIKDDQARQAAAADAAAKEAADPTQWTFSSPVGVAAREDMCLIGRDLHTGGPQVQTVAATALAGTATDRRAVSPIAAYGTDAITAADHRDGSDIAAWLAADNNRGQLIADIPSELTYWPGQSTGKFELPVFDTDMRDFLWHRLAWSQNTTLIYPQAQADQASLDRAIAIAAASTDPVMPYLRNLVANTASGGYSTDPEDIAAFLTNGGFPQAAPADGTLEFRTDVEALKARWAGCNSANPWDPHHVLTAEVVTATAEWQSEMAGQKAQRDDIVTASIAATADLQKASDAMTNAQVLAWADQQLLGWQRYWAAHPDLYTFYGMDPALKTQATNAMVALPGKIQAQLAIANAAATDAKAQADKVTADQAAAGAIAKTNGTPYGRGLAYAQQSAQVTKASAAATQAAALATQTTLQASQASGADADALWSLADTQAHALKAQFAKVAAQDAAAQAHNAALAAADQAAQAATNAATAHTDRGIAEAAQATATAQAGIAKAKRQDADTQQRAAADARSNAKTQQDKAAA